MSVNHKNVLCNLDNGLGKLKKKASIDGKMSKEIESNVMVPLLIVQVVVLY